MPALRIQRARSRSFKLHPFRRRGHAAIAPSSRPLASDALAPRSRRGEHQLGDLGRAKQPHGRSPVAGAPTDVDLRSLAMPMQAGHVGLIQAYQGSKRPYLPSVGVPRKLKAYAG